MSSPRNAATLGTRTPSATQAVETTNEFTSENTTTINVDVFLERAPLALVGKAFGANPDPESRAWFCHICQRTEAQKVLRAPSAYATSHNFWRCLNCGCNGARYQAVAAIRRNPTAFERARLIAMSSSRGRAA